MNKPRAMVTMTIPNICSPRRLNGSNTARLSATEITELLAAPATRASQMLAPAWFTVYAASAPMVMMAP